MNRSIKINQKKESPKIGYARVSTTDQNLDGQLDLLKKEGCLYFHSEKVSGAKNQKPELEKCLSSLREGDTLVVTKLDRLGRTLKGLVLLIENLRERGIHFKCLDEPIDTTSSTGEFFFHIMGAFAQLERDLIRERTKIGLDAARKRGRYGGRPESIDKDKKELAYDMYMKNDEPLTKISKTLGMSRMTIYRYIEKRAKEKANETTQLFRG
jgi:DNA invertase Pin-like site-specific DNA recombinase